MDSGAGGVSDLREYEVWARTAAFSRRVEGAKRVLDDAASRGECVVMTSWGKDSVAQLDLAIEHLGPVRAIHLASSYRLPGSERVAEHFAARCDVSAVPDARSVEDVIAWLREVGLPHEREGSGRKAGTRIKTSRGAAALADSGARLQMLGMRIAEGGPRAIWLRRAGPVYEARGAWVACPLAYWSTRDVWAYIASRGLPYPALYDCETHGQTRETLRNTGWLTLAGAQEGRVAWLEAHYPDEYRRLREAFPRVETLR